MGVHYGLWLGLWLGVGDPRLPLRSGGGVPVRGSGRRLKLKV